MNITNDKAGRTDEEGYVFKDQIKLFPAKPWEMVFLFCIVVEQKCPHLSKISNKFIFCPSVRPDAGKQDSRPRDSVEVTA